MKRIALMTTAMTAAVLMMAGTTFADEMTRTTIEGSKHVITTPADPVEAPPLVQEKSYLQTEQRSLTVTSDPVPSPPPVQKRSSNSYKTEEQSSSTSDPLNPQEKTTTHSRVEKRSSTVVPTPEVQQHTTIERRSSTVTAE
jgi:hypothetical protein